MDVDEYLAILEKTGATLEELPTKERWRVMQQWREVFAASYHAASGKWKRTQFDWHIFSFQDANSVQGSRASALYEQQLALTFFVVPERTDLPAFRRPVARLPRILGRPLRMAR